MQEKRATIISGVLSLRKDKQVSLTSEARKQRTPRYRNTLLHELLNYGEIPRCKFFNDSKEMFWSLNLVHVQSS